MTKPNLIKQVREQYSLSYAELAEITGAKESTLKNSASSGDISGIIESSIKWYMEAQETKEELNSFQQLRTLLSSFISK